ncbi:MAG TPA: ribose 5-phosphate isomerase B [Myxococcota bacterium]|nr:ribose 5-phosphate isomerase B [Myxococcota bacterium]HRY94888.1 ribose 5-phosphate isomerase B [Myxococcota bacterium]HSA22669.1 ribose 5-phosphate isomerase B [Myxococcota bacterium]
MNAASALPVAVASDHGGLGLKGLVVARLQAWGHQVEDLGTQGTASVDYPDFAARLAAGVVAGRYRLGVLVCGTGIGMSIMANRFRGVRAAVCGSAYTARMARAHNDANVLCLGERVTGPGEAEDILRAFLDTPFEGGRHARRVEKLDGQA